MLTRYLPEFEDIVFADPPPPSRYLPGAGGGGGSSGGSSAPSVKPNKTPLSDYSPSELRQLWRADRISEDEWQTELQARNMTAQAARDEISRQKNVGLSTAASTRGQPTASEKAAVDALKGSAPTAEQLLDQRIARGDYGLQGPTPSGAPLEDITGRASSGSVGPEGRTVDEIRGKDYLSDAERSWYLAQTKGTPAPAGGTARASTGGGSTSAAPAASGTRATAAPAGKLLQGSISRDELDSLKATFSGALASIRNADGTTDVYVRQPDGSYDYRRTDAAQTVPQRKLSPAEQAATSFVNTQQILRGSPPLEGDVTLGRERTPPSVGSVTGLPPSEIMGGGQEYYAQPQEIRGPVSALGQPGELVGVEMPYAGGSRQYHVGTARGDIQAAGMIPTGDPSKDLQTALAINAKRANMLAEGMSPLQVQDFFDTQNLGKDVYSRAKAVSAMEDAAARAIRGERPPPYGTDQLTASMLSNYITPRPEEETPAYAYNPLGYAMGTEEDQPILAGAPPDPMQVDPMKSWQDDTTASDARLATARGMGTPRYTSDGLGIVRGTGHNAEYMPLTGGGYQPLWYAMRPNLEQYTEEGWGGYVPPPSSVIADEYRIGIEPEFDRWLKRFGLSGTLRWKGTESARGNISGPGFQSRTVPFAQGTDPYAPIMAGMDTPAPGRPGFVTPEPLAMVGMQSGRMMGMAGEAGPEAISVMPMRPPMLAPYKTQKPVMLVDPMRALMEMKA